MHTDRSNPFKYLKMKTIPDSTQLISGTLVESQNKLLFPALFLLFISIISNISPPYPPLISPPIPEDNSFLLVIKIYILIPTTISLLVIHNYLIKHLFLHSSASPGETIYDTSCNISPAHKVWQSLKIYHPFPPPQKTASHYSNP